MSCVLTSRGSVPSGCGGLGEDAQVVDEAVGFGQTGRDGEDEARGLGERRGEKGIGRPRERGDGNRGDRPRRCGG